jgi:hypothetical protein
MKIVTFLAVPFWSISKAPAPSITQLHTSDFSRRLQPLKVREHLRGLFLAAVLDQAGVAGTAAWISVSVVRSGPVSRARKH